MIRLARVPIIFRELIGGEDRVARLGRRRELVENVLGESLRNLVDDCLATPLLDALLDRFGNYMQADRLFAASNKSSCPYARFAMWPYME